jgi:shikimate kinase
MPQPIIITGFMGAGKTTVAAALSRMLGREMVDLDIFISKKLERTPREIIDEDGEESFRGIEGCALREVLEADGARIVALGGGTWTIAGNRALVKEHDGVTIWLDAPFELCWQRIEDERDARPLGRDFKAARALYDRRREFYDEAMLRIEVGEEKTAEAIAAEIVDVLAAAASGEIPARGKAKTETRQGEGS